jgi:hypothetical protein
MKKLILLVSLLVVIFWTSGPVLSAEFKPPLGALYGVTVAGDYFVAKKLVEAAEGEKPKAMYGPAWDRKAMTLVGDYFVYRSGVKKRVGIKTDFCFDIGGNRFLPHALIENEMIKQSDAVDNGVGGYNFRMVSYETQ